MTQEEKMIEQLRALHERGPTVKKKPTKKQAAVKMLNIKLTCVACQWEFVDPNPSFNQINNPVCRNCTMYY